MILKQGKPKVPLQPTEIFNQKLYENFPISISLISHIRLIKHSNTLYNKRKFLQFFSNKMKNGKIYEQHEIV
jgi:hypothetical protein